MRVTMLVRCLAMMRGGGETRHLAWARELDALGVDVEIIAGVPLVSGVARYPVDGVDVDMVRSPYARDFVYRCQNRPGFGRLTMTALHLDEEWFCRAAWRRIATSTRRPDVVHAHALHQAARLRVGEIPVVINLPGAPNPRYAADLRDADALVADGWAAANLPALLGTAVERLPKGVDGERFCPDGPNVREQLGLTGKRVVLTVARLVPIKNVQRLLDAMTLVRTHSADAHLVIVGDGPEADAMRQHAVDLGLTDAVTFAGYVPHADTPAFYRAADVFALSSDLCSRQWRPGFRL
jgi:glycosyltransferase involved in cell wall biosynthesis